MNTFFNESNLLAQIQKFVEEAVEKRLSETENEKKPKLYTRSEVRDLLNISDATIWRWVKSGILNSKKIGRRVYFTETEVNEILTQNQ